MEIKQYEIFLVNLNPTIGSEIKKTRPCVIISPNEMNKYLRTVVIAPMTTCSKNYPTRVDIKHDNKIGWVVLDQIRTVDKQGVLK
jgi:mRNA interferase MazF